MTNENNIPKINREDAVAITLTFHRLGDQRDGDINEIETSADKNMCRMVKKLFGGKKEKSKDGSENDSTCEEYNAIRSYDGKLYRWLCEQSVSLLGRRNVRLISKNAISNIEKKLQTAQNERQLLVDKFLTVYPVVVEAARTKLNNQYQESDYPNVNDVARRFSIDWNYLALGVPDNLPGEVKEIALAKMEKTWEEAGEQIRDGLRIGFVKLVEHLVDMLQPSQDGKRKRFCDSNVVNIVEFIDTLAQRNLTNDNELVNIANQAKDLIEKYAGDIKEMKSDAETRKAVIDGMSKVKDACNALIGTEKKRKFDLE